MEMPQNCPNELRQEIRMIQVAEILLRFDSQTGADDHNGAIISVSTVFGLLLGWMSMLRSVGSLLFSEKAVLLNTLQALGE